MECHSAIQSVYHSVAAAGYICVLLNGLMAVIPRLSIVHCTHLYGRVPPSIAAVSMCSVAMESSAGNQSVVSPYKGAHITGGPDEVVANIQADGKLGPLYDVQGGLVDRVLGERKRASRWRDW